MANDHFSPQPNTVIHSRLGRVEKCLSQGGGILKSNTKMIIKKKKNVYLFANYEIHQNRMLFIR